MNASVATRSSQRTPLPDLLASARALSESLAAMGVDPDSRPDVVVVCRTWAHRVAELERRAIRLLSTKRAQAVGLAAQAATEGAVLA